MLLIILPDSFLPDTSYTPQGLYHVSGKYESYNITSKEKHTRHMISMA